MDNLSKIPVSVTLSLKIVDLLDEMLYLTQIHSLPLSVSVSSRSVEATMTCIGYNYNLNNFIELLQKNFEKQFLVPCLFRLCHFITMKLNHD